MEEKLMHAATEGNIDSLYDLLEEDPLILETIHQTPFTDTPLHISASLGHTLFALEIMNLAPSFGSKLNARGLSPLDLALRNSHTETVQRLVKFYPELIRVRGRGRMTPLHHVAEVGEVDLLAEFLLSSPSSIRDLTSRDETALHLAVKNTRLPAFKVLLGMVQRTGHGNILNWKDEDGNTVLHIATSTNQTEVFELLAKVKFLELDHLNLEGDTPLDIAMRVPLDTNEKIRKTLKSKRAFQASSLIKAVTSAQFLSSRPMHFIESIYSLDIYLELGLSGNMRNALLVAAALIATATYQTLLQPPGGFSQPTDTSQIQRESQLADSYVRLAMSDLYYYPMIGLNSLAFTTSMGVIVLLLPFSRFTNFLRISLTLFTYNYMWSLYIISPQAQAVKTSLLLLFLPSFHLIISFRFWSEYKLLRFLRYSSCSRFAPIFRHFRTTRSVFIKYWRSVAAEKAHFDIYGT